VQGASVRMDLPIRDLDETLAAEATASEGAEQQTKAPEAAE
jgi:hypothetical protein